jgi:endonuclease-3
VLKSEYPDAKIALRYEDPLELLVATILSAQCTDERVNKVTVMLFKKYRTAKDYATVNPAELEQDIRSTGFFHAKAKNIIQCCKQLVERFHGKVPDTMEELVQLPGVGRKTANVVLGGAFGKTEGIVVDTHIGRLSQRMGFTHNQDPVKIESDLMEIIPKNNWILIGNLLIRHGRTTCQARKPDCPACRVKDYCPSADEFLKLATAGGTKPRR